LRIEDPTLARPFFVRLKFYLFAAKIFREKARLLRNCSRACTQPKQENAPSSLLRSKKKLFNRFIWSHALARNNTLHVNYDRNQVQQVVPMYQTIIFTHFRGGVGSGVVLIFHSLRFHF
jgi:hypothetical protein